MRVFLSVIGIFVFCAAAAQKQQFIPLPFLDDFTSAVDGRPNPAWWRKSTVFANNSYVPAGQALGVVTFDILDGDGLVYPHAGPSVFAADTLESDTFAIASDAANVYLSFDFMPGGLGDMPEQGDKLTLWFYNPHSREWSLVWTAETSATIASTSDIVISEEYPFNDTIVRSTWNDGRFLRAIVQVPTVFRDTGFCFRFVNLASRNANSILGMSGNCDMWHVGLVYLDAGRSPTATNITDMALQLPTTSLLKGYATMPWRHLVGSDAARRDQLLTDGYVRLPFYLRNLSRSGSAYPDVNVRLWLEQGGNWSKTFDMPKSAPNFFPDTVIRSETSVSLTDLLGAPDADADTVAFGIQIAISRYTAASALWHLLTYNDTGRYIQRFYSYYAYDDGTAENGFGVFGEHTQNAKIAVKFHSYLRDTLSAVYMYFNHTQDSSNMLPFTLTVWNSGDGGAPGDEIYTQACKVQFLGLNRFVRYEFARPVVVEGDFFVGLSQQDAAMLNIGVDINNTKPDKTYVRMTAQWEPSRIDLVGSLMIRPSFARHNWDWNNLATHAVPLFADADVAVYPNPATREIHLFIPDNIRHTATQITICDVVGKCVLRLPVTETVDISTLPAGIYFLQVMSSQGKPTAAQKILVLPH